MSDNIFDIEVQPLSAWSPSGDKPLIIAGPCSAETESQTLTTAKSLCGHVNIFRAGIWKPRTDPDSFKGVGEEALKWLQRVKNDYSLPCATEVLSPAQVELALKYQVDYLWLGARTTINPFVVEEIAAALKGVDIPVFVKNPLSPDLSVWVGAIRRLNKNGIKKIAAVHRGFNSLYAAPLRNDPIWNIPIKLKCMYPSLPLLCDPSHIAGDVKFVDAIIRKAISLDMTGLMVEVHANPETALSDSRQQLTPDRFLTILSHISDYITKPLYKNEVAEDTPEIKQLEYLRSLISTFDENLLNTVSQRLHTVEEIGTIKEKLNMPALNVSRWNQFITDLMELIHRESLELQNKSN